MKILIINGPNINMLGIREPEIYGSLTYQELCEYIKTHTAHDLVFFQSNGEKEIIDAIQAAHNHYDGIVINPAAYTHTSIAILDALKSVNVDAVEVHLSDITKREAFRQISITKAGCIAQIYGKGKDGYLEAIACLERRLK